MLENSSRSLFALGFFALVSFPTKADASYYIELYNYFSLIPALPIVTPQNERPGDIYDIPGTIYARKADCFPEAKVDSSETYFLRALTLDIRNLSGEAAAAREMIGQITAEAGTSLENSVKVSFGESGKVKWDQITVRNLGTLLSDQNTKNACRQRLLSLLRSTSDDPNSVPWIIQSVWYATVNTAYRTTTRVSAAASGVIRSRLSSVDASGATQTEQQSERLTIANTGRTPFPIAWRPAFISQSHYEYIHQLLYADWLRSLMKQIYLSKSDQEILEILRKDFQFDFRKIPTPKEIARDMTRGKPISFEPDNKEHLLYMQATDVLIGVSEAIAAIGK
ncbi:hypothetical protein [Bradyrhizobium sp. SZCCHNRI3043]|uniref:hypothetical protein n=1 Tax=Bradyrhizobium sp. SZCCHNRI3043 TaxID=3057292 RepID=UPI0028EB0534|nr:hypothetical protein [Bradyrhizobium sp. SZCCHNRI3043]